MKQIDRLKSHYITVLRAITWLTDQSFKAYPPRAMLPQNPQVHVIMDSSHRTINLPLNYTQTTLNCSFTSLSDYLTSL